MSTTSRTITLIRHAKSSWGDPSITDFERALNDRGVGDAPRIGAALKTAGIAFQQVMCSDATRAMQTLSLIAPECDISEGSIAYRHDMYCANSSHLLSCIHHADDDNHDIALVGHNPGMEELANFISNENIGNMETCCSIILRFNSEHWQDVNENSGNVVLILRPRDL